MIPETPGTGTKTPDFNALMKGIGGDKKGKGTEKIDLDRITPDYKGTTAYSAIAARFATVKMQPAANTTKIVPLPAPEAGPVQLAAGNQQPAPVKLSAEAIQPGDQTDYAGEKTDWLKTISGHLERITAATGPTLANLQRIAACTAATVAIAGTLNAGAAIPQPSPATGVNITSIQPSPVLAQMPGVKITNTPPPVLAPPPERPTISNQYNEQNQNAYETRNTRSVHFEKYCENIVINVQNTDQRGQDEIEKAVRKTLTDIMNNYEV